MSAMELRARIHAAVERWTAELVGLSHSLHAEPELGFAEYGSRDKVVRLAEAAGFFVETSVGGLETAFVARYGDGELVVAFCAEYDALPEIGHACGHNVNGAASVGAALALAAVADELGVTVKLIGTPAEETEGGKIQLLEAGVFDDVSAAMMVHAGAEDELGLSSYALCMWDVEYAGVPAHAATAPWAGVNAADAVALAYQAVGLLRQQLAPGLVVSFVIAEGGHSANVIPARARAQVELRASTTAELEGLQSRVRACLDAGALATGTTVVVTPRGRQFAELRQDDALTAAYTRALREVGRAGVVHHGEPRASTDMGNVSLLVPSLHPMIGYDVGGAAHHTAEFARHGTSPSADRAVLDGATALALVGEEIAADPALRSRLLRNRRLLVAEP